MACPEPRGAAACSRGAPEGSRAGDRGHPRRAPSAPRRKWRGDRRRTGGRARSSGCRGEACLAPTRRAASSSSCRSPFEDTAVPVSIRASPCASVNRPPASSTITCTAARSHTLTPVASSAPSTAPSATSMCAQKSPTPRTCQARSAIAGSWESRGNERTESSMRATDETLRRSSPEKAPAPLSAHQRRASAGADTTPSRIVPSSSSAISVAQIGKPRE